ncbi:MAG: DUF1223 domain-containing protein [Pseudomonadota bacterium]
MVELFTSQGCSSCPPADALLADLAEREDIIALSLHVDYWDYIGWSDTFADAAYSARQRAYAQAAGTNVVYTPQMIIGGADFVVGHRPMAVFDAIMDQADAPASIEVTVEASGDSFVIEAQMVGAAPGAGLLVQMIGYVPEQSVDIRRGENANRTLTYHNIVTSWDLLAEWTGAAQLSVQVQPGSGAHYVVIFQEHGPGRILAAARLQ